MPLKISLTFILFLFAYSASAQHDELIIQLNRKDSVKEKIPFFLKSVTFHTKNLPKLGLVYDKKKELIYQAILENKSEHTIEEMLKQRFVQLETNLPVRMAVTQLMISSKIPNEVDPDDSLIFNCSFIAMKENAEDTLFLFRSKNAMGQFEQPKVVTENYLHRALISSIHQFSKAFNSHPEWHRLKNEEDFKLKTLLVHNKFSEFDSIACQPERRLSIEDFQINKTKDSSKQEGLCRLVLTYQASAEEDNKGIQLSIYTKAFFDKQRSWRKVTNNSTAWLAYQQGHFDLCTFYGFLLRDSMKSYPYSVGEFKSELNKIYNHFYQQYTNERKQYQDETDYGSQLLQVEQWQQKIRNKLSSYKNEH